MFRRPAALAALFAFLALPLGAADDEPKFDEADPKGKPAAYKTGSGKFAVWQDKDGWHVRASAKKNDQTFSGQIDAVDGKFATVKFVEKGGGALPPFTKTKSIDVDFKMIKGGESGFDLKLDDAATAIKFTLKVDGQELPEAILIGAKGKNPKGAEFVLPAMPKKK